MRSTLLVRCLMEAHGKDTVYTNKYKTCRSVKCYAGFEDNTALINSITEALNAAKIPFSVNCTASQNHGYTPASLIIRLPL